MAISIRPTPTLKGEHAERFLSKIEEDQNNKIDFSDKLEKAKKIIAKSNKAQNNK
jgi:hypothetical protein